MEQNRIQRMRTEKEDETKIELIVRRRVKECERELKKKQEKIMAEKEEKKEWSGGARIHQWYIDGRDTKIVIQFFYTNGRDTIIVIHFFSMVTII